jgi:hypothetical protein
MRKANGAAEFIALFVGAAAAWPLAARALQTTKTHRIALVHPSVSIADMSEGGGNLYFPTTGHPAF